MNSRTLVFTLIACIGLSACSEAKFSSAEKAALKKSVFTGEEIAANQTEDYANSINQPAVGGPATGSVSQPPTTGPATGSVSQPPANPATGAISQLPIWPPANVAFPDISKDSNAALKQLIEAGGKIKVAYVCTVPEPQREGTESEPAISGSKDQLSIKINGKVCSADSAKIVAQLKAKALDLTALCPDLAKEIKSFAFLVNSKVNTIMDPSQPLAVEYVQLLNLIPKSLAVLYANPRTDADLSECDSMADPLTVHVGRSKAGPIALSDRFNGVEFDLLGRSNRHVPVRTAWFTNNEYGFLALPNAKGQVKGINELFGDNTAGPDRKFAKHGYDALAKHDSNRDGRIDKKDPVFASLRVWVDRDRNGVAAASELLTMAEAEIEYIRLDYSTEFSETDKHGNMTNMKSIIGRPDGSLDVIFDLWLTYLRK